MHTIHAIIPNRQLSRFLSRAALLAGVFGAAAPAFAQQMIGQQLLDFGANYIIGPLGIFAVVVALAGSIFRPDLVKSAVYAAIICAVLFFVIKSAPRILTAFQS